MSEESDKAYRRKWYMQHREEQIARTKQYREEHKEELYLKRKEAARERMRRYREEHPDKVKETRQRHNEKIKQELRENQYTVTKEEWFKRYGYEMGSTEGWEHWLGWDNRTRRSEE